MNVADNRSLIGFGADTPSGEWYDSVCVPALDVYSTTYRTWSSLATRTPLALDNLKDAERVYFPLYRQFHATVKASALVSNSSLEAMGFPPRHEGGGQRHPVNRTFIDLSVRPIGYVALSVAFENRDTGSSVIPYYLTGAVVSHSVSTTPVTDPNHLTHSRLATRSPMRIFFEPELRGATVYFAARWQNRRGELGPWSDISVAIIP
jgi:hypothetical protein